MRFFEADAAGEHEEPQKCKRSAKRSCERESKRDARENERLIAWMADEAIRPGLGHFAVRYVAREMREELAVSPEKQQHACQRNCEAKPLQCGPRERGHQAPMPVIEKNGKLEDGQNHNELQSPRIVGVAGKFRANLIIMLEAA